MEKEKFAFICNGSAAYLSIHDTYEEAKTKRDKYEKGQVIFKIIIIEDNPQSL